ncbi:MAG: hypothetical protein J4G16_04815 [Acidobacteria bacterium]|nr:hypothetical protein [Acidobacteriota bacterium]
MAMKHRSICYLAAAAILLLPLTAAAQGTVRIVQTNSAGDNVHFIDPVTNEVVGVTARRRPPTASGCTWPTSPTTRSTSSTLRR